MNDVWAEVAAEREDLASLLDELTPQQWETQSLCTEWRVRDVVGHLVEATNKLAIGKVVVGVAKAGFNVNKMLEKSAKEWGARPTEELAKQLRENAGSRNTPPMTKPVHVLSDTMIHAQDIRRPLNKPRAIPSERLKVVLDTMAGQGSILGNKKRIAGVTLAATDIDWRHGAGPEVRGSGEALLMAMCGRTTAIDDLEGDGIATLRSRG